MKFLAVRYPRAARLACRSCPFIDSTKALLRWSRSKLGVKVFHFPHQEILSPVRSVLLVILCIDCSVQFSWLNTPAARAKITRVATNFIAISSSSAPASEPWDRGNGRPDPT